MSKSIITLVNEIREELGLSRGVPPKIEKVIEHEDGSFHIITSDRAEKSLLLGPGGRIATELAKRLSRRLTIYGEDELLLKRHRLNLTLRRIDEVYDSSTQDQQQFLQKLRDMISNEKKFPENSAHSKNLSKSNLKIATAFSGGIDSSATIFILQNNGFSPDALTVKLGQKFYTPNEIKKLEQWCEKNNVNHIPVPPIRKMTELVQSTNEGRIHPCGKCHEIILESVTGYAKEKKYSILVTGELLPSGRQSIVQEEELIIVHLPAALGLSKYRTEIFTQESGKVLGRRKFGCRLVTEANKRGWRNIGPSIFRVLRELEAGVLTTGQGLEYIKDIVKPYINKGG